MAQVMVGVKQVLGVNLDVYADANGMWWLREQAAEEGQQNGKILGSGESLKSAVAKARTELKKRDVKVSVPFRLADGRSAIAYGIHQGNGQVLIEFADGSKDSIGGGRGMGRAQILKADTPDEQVQRLGELNDRIRELSAQAKTIEGKWAIDMTLTWHVQRAIDRAAEAASGA